MTLRVTLLLGARLHVTVYVTPGVTLHVTPHLDNGSQMPAHTEVTP